MIAQLQNILTSRRQLHVLCENPVVKGIKKIIENCEKKTSGISEKCTRPNWPPRLECWQENQSSFWLVQFLPAHLTSSHLFCFVEQTTANNKQWYGRSFLGQTPCSRRLGRAVRWTVQLIAEQCLVLIWDWAEWMNDDTFNIQRTDIEISLLQKPIDLHDTRHLCTRFRIDGIKAMSRGISGGRGNKW